MLRKLQIFRFVLIEMFSPCFLNSHVMSFLVRSDCGPLAFLRSTSPLSLFRPLFFAIFFAEVVQEEKSGELTHFCSIKAAHSYIQHAAVDFPGPGGLVVK